MFLSPKQAHYAFPIVMIAIMTFVLTGVTGWIRNDFVLHLEQWMKGWALAYVIALPTMLTISPPLRKAIAKRTRAEG